MHSHSSTKIIIIGAGVVGCAIARELSRYDLDIIVLEQHSDVAEETSKANSAVVHAGFNVPAGTLKAKTNVEGFFKIPGLANELGFPYRKTGKIVTGYTKRDLARLTKLKETGDKNGCSGLEIIKGTAIQKVEPMATGKYALYSKDTGILSSFLFTIALAENAHSNGACFYLNTKVTGIDRAHDGFNIHTDNGEFTANWVINSAGLHSDTISKFAGDDRFRIYPCRGEYLITDIDTQGILRSMVYPLPNEDGSGLGVHVTSTIEGNILFGPAAEYIENINDTSNTRDMIETLKKEAYNLIPELKSLPVIHSYAGIRPKLIHPSTGESFRDFVIEESPLIPGLINLIGIESPGLTASPAIAEMIRDIIGNKEDIKEKPDFNPHHQSNKLFSMEKKSNRIKRVAANPDEGEIICRCETVTKAELKTALDNPLGVKTLDGIKKRCRAGAGRCQGGFCTPRITKTLIDDYNIEETNIIKNKPGSNLYFGKLK